MLDGLLLIHVNLFYFLTGTGKTVVGVHIVYWFFKENQKLPRLDKSVEKGPKKRCILYCGPSNKSVDVVAGMLFTLTVIN